MKRRIKHLNLLVSIFLVISLLTGCKPTVSTTSAIFSSDTTSPLSWPVTTSYKVKSQCDAVKIAEKTIPESILDNASSPCCGFNPTHGPNGVWFVEYMLFNEDKVTREQLGWQPGENVQFDPDPENTYGLLDIEIDPITAEIILKKATNGFLLGGPYSYPQCDP